MGSKDLVLETRMMFVFLQVVIKDSVHIVRIEYHVGVTVQIVELDGILFGAEDVNVINEECYWKRRKKEMKLREIGMM